MSIASTSAQPPLTGWQQAWRYLAAVTIGGLVFVGPGRALWGSNRLWFAADLALGLVGLVLMAFRRRHPVAVASILAVFGVVSASSAGAGIVAYVSMATHRRLRQIIPVAVLAFLTGLVYSSLDPERQGAWYVDVTFNAVFIGILTATGMYVGARRELLASLRERAERAELEQAMRVAQARANERARLAREMHDVLAHRISLVAMHAGALAYRSDLDPQQTRDAAAVIQDNAHIALVDLREVLGLLREGSDDGDRPERPQPTLCDIAALVDEARAAGMRVTLSDELPDPRSVPETIGRNAYRVVQEGLTNARKHAPQTTVHVSLSGAPGQRLRLEVRNPLPVGTNGARAPMSGLGLIGLAERAAISGGRLEHQTTPDRQFVLRAWLPWPP